MLKKYLEKQPKQTNEKKVVILVAVRMKSTRLPKKAITKIEDKTALEHLLDRLKLAKVPETIVVCTTINTEDDILVEIAKKNNVKYFRGSEKDVLFRFLGAADQEKAEIIVRATGDNILVDPVFLDRAIQYHVQKKADYTSIKNLPSGVKCEVMSAPALKKIHQLAEAPQFSEYLTWYFTKNPSFFKMVDLPVEEKFNRPNFRLTLDTPEDLELLRVIFKNLYRKSQPPFGTQELFSFLDKNPDLLKINADVVHKDFSAMEKGINVRFKKPKT